MIHTAILLTGGGNTPVFLEGKEQNVSLPERLVSTSYSGSTGPPARRQIISLPLPFMFRGANSLEREEKITHSLKMWLRNRPEVLFQDSRHETHKGCCSFTLLSSPGVSSYCSSRDVYVHNRHNCTSREMFSPAAPNSPLWHRS